MTFIVQKEVLGGIIICIPISRRIISIRISARPHNITVIRVYAQTLGQEDEEVEQFYAHIDSMIPKTPRKDILAVLGDWNAKVGPDAYLHWAGTIGRCGIGETNDRGRRLPEFAKSHRLTFANTVHPHRLSRTATWHAVLEQVHNQIDFILTPQRLKSGDNKIFPRCQHWLRS